jgi:hypothetical protein
MAFGGITRDYKPALIIAESATVNAESYVGDFVDQSGIISDMNQPYGPHNWQYQQDGTRGHTASSTTAYLNAMATVIENWPACSPDLNPIENLWAIMKRRVEGLQPQTKEELINVLIDVWNTLDIELINALVDSRTRRLALAIEKAGERIPY